MFKENELVMYGSTGVCRVKEIGRPSFVDKDDKRIYYLLEPVFRAVSSIHLSTMRRFLSER